jgi:GGDEF domain-containing protein
MPGAVRNNSDVIPAFSYRGLELAPALAFIGGDGSVTLAQRSAALKTGEKHGAGGLEYLVDRALFDRLLNIEVHKAGRFLYAVSVVCLTLDDPKGTAEPRFWDSLARLCLNELRATDVVASVNSGVAGILLVGAETQDLPGILARVRPTLEGLIGEAGRHDLYTLSAGGGCYPHTAKNGSELLEQAVELMNRAQTDGGNRAYLPS